MRTTRILDVLLPHTRQGILTATLLQPDRAWYAADLARHLKTSRSSLQRELLHLVGAGILKSWREGRMVYVQADPECPVFTELRGLLAKTTGLVDVLRDALKPFVDRIQMAFVYGSVARAEEKSTSDIDLMIIGEVSLRDIATVVRDTQEKTGREVNPKICSPEKFAKRLTARDHFMLNVLDKPKLFVIGTQHELDDLVERESGGGASINQV